MIFPLICTLSFVYTQEENTYKLHFSKVKTAVILHFSKVKTAEFLHFSKVKIAIILHFSKILHVFGNEYPEPKGTPQRETCVQGTPRRGNERIAQGDALGRLAAAIAPCKGKSMDAKPCILTLLPFQGALHRFIIPRALPWAMCSLPLRGVP